MAVFFEILIFYVEIMSPFLLLCSYSFLGKIQWLLNPVVVIASIASLSAYVFIPTLYWHFAADGTVFVIGYVACYLKRYSRRDSLVLPSLALIASDQLWQVPIYLNEGLADHWKGLNFLIAAPWAFMAVPLIFYFLIRIKGEVGADSRSRFLFLSSVGATSVLTLSYWPVMASTFSIAGYDVFYIAFFLWFAFFLSLISSRARSIR